VRIRGLRICQFSDHFEILKTNIIEIRLEFRRNFLNKERICIRRPEKKDVNKNSDSTENKSDS